MFDVKTVFDDEMVAIALKGVTHLRLPAKVTPADLTKLQVVLYESGAHTRLVVDRWVSRAGISLKPIMELGSVEAIKEIVGAGLGCAILPRIAVGHTKSRYKVEIRSLDPPLRRKLAIVLRRDKPLNRGLREVVAAIKKQAAEAVFRQSWPTNDR